MMGRRDTFGLSGDECARALERLGLTYVRRDDGWTIFRRGVRFVVVPDAAVLPTPILDVILTRAALSLEELLGALDDIPTEPHVHVR